MLPALRVCRCFYSGYIVVFVAPAAVRRRLSVWRAMSDFEPFYNVDLSYGDNYARGPFGEFAAALRGDVPAGEAASPAKSSFLGIPVDLPFGIPAGPLLNERFTTAAFRMGFDIATYKTCARARGGVIRSRTCWPCTRPVPTAH